MFDTCTIHFGEELSCDLDFVYLIDLPVILLVLNINIESRNNDNR